MVTVDIANMGGAGVLLILHDDADYELAARHLPDIRARRNVDADQ